MEGVAPIAETSETFDELVAIHRQRIFRFALASLRDRDAAESVTQDCFLRAWQAWPQFRGDSSVQTWLTRIAINLIRDAARSRRFQFWKQADTTDTFIPDATVDFSNRPHNPSEAYFNYVQTLGDLNVFQSPSTVTGYPGCTSCVFGENNTILRSQMAIWTVTGMGLVPESVLNINTPTGPNVWSTLPTITVPFTFTIYNQTYNGLPDAAQWGQFLLQSSSAGDAIQGPLYCYGAWAEASGTAYLNLDLNAPPGQQITGYNNPLADTFCTVSLVSVNNVANGVQATVNFTFTPSAQGATYNVFHEVIYSQEDGPWENVGTLTVQTSQFLVSGTVTDSVFGNPIVGTVVAAFDTSGNQVTAGVAQDGGIFNLLLAAGNYVIEAIDDVNYAYNPYNGIAMNILAAQSGIKFQGVRKGVISGYVFLDGNVPTGGLTVSMFGTQANGKQVGGSTIVSDTGLYSFNVANGGTYTIYNPLTPFNYCPTNSFPSATSNITCALAKGENWVCNNCTASNAYNFGATVADCQVSPPYLNVGGLPWADGSTIQLAANAGFPSSFKGISLAAILSTVAGNWNSVLGQDLCTPVTMTTLPGNAQAFLQWTSPNNLPSPNTRGYTKFVGNAVFGGQGGRLSSVTILINNTITDPNALAEVISHEIGHTFDLDDCNPNNPCVLHSSTMVSGGTDPNNGTINALEGLPGPTTCDFSVTANQNPDLVPPCNQGRINAPEQQLAQLGGARGRRLIGSYLEVDGRRLRFPARSIVLLEPKRCPALPAGSADEPTWLAGNLSETKLATATVGADGLGRGSRVDLSGATGTLLVDSTGKILRAWAGLLSVRQYEELRLEVARLPKKRGRANVYLLEKL